MQEGRIDDRAGTSIRSRHQGQCRAHPARIPRRGWAPTTAPASSRWTGTRGPRARTHPAAGCHLHGSAERDEEKRTVSADIDQGVSNPQIPPRSTLMRHPQCAASAIAL